jgi:hypothetical protein
MDDPRFQQFFSDPQTAQQRRYEAIRAVVIEEQSLQEVAARFGFAYGTLRNLLAQFRVGIRQGRTPPFSLPSHADGPPAYPRNLVPIGPRLPIAVCWRWIDFTPSARALPGSSCFCLCSPSSAWIGWFATQVIPAHT